MKYIKTILAILFFSIPCFTFASVPVAWNASSTDAGSIQPNAVNGNFPFVKAPYMVATSTTKASIFPYASTTAISATTICLIGDICRTTWPTGGSGTNFWTQSGSTIYNNVGPTVSFPNFIATSTSNTTGTSTIAGSLMVGNAIFGGQFAPTGFLNSTGYSQGSFSANVGDSITLLTIANPSLSTLANGCITFDNANTPFTGGAFATYNANICYSGPNWNTFPGQQANGLAIDNTDGHIVFGALSANFASSSLDFAAGPGFSSANYDVRILNLDPSIYPNTSGFANLTIGSTSPYSRFTITSPSNSGIPYITVASTTGATNSTIGSLPQQTVFTILSNGNTGIATSSPGRTFSVNGSSDLGTNATAGTFTGSSVSATSTFPNAQVGTSTTPVFSVLSGQFYRKVGSNQAMGTSTLSSGTVTVSNTMVRADSVIQLTDQTGGANLGSLSVGTKTAGTSFVINSSNVLDASTVLWEIIQPIY